MELNDFLDFSLLFWSQYPIDYHLVYLLQNVTEMELHSCIALDDWLLTLTNMHLGLMHIFVCLYYWIVVHCMGITQALYPFMWKRTFVFFLDILKKSFRECFWFLFKWRHSMAEKKNVSSVFSFISVGSSWNLFQRWMNNYLKFLLLVK